MNRSVALPIVLAFAAAAPHAFVEHARVSFGDVSPIVLHTSPHPEVHTDARSRLRAAIGSTYLGEILTRRDSCIARWPEARTKPLGVWIQPRSRATDFSPTYMDDVRQALGDWNALALPVRFTVIADSARAQVRVIWTDRFSEPISGRTRWTRDDTWEIQSARILLAVHHSHGEQLAHDEMHALALHELGHVLGLDHTHDNASIMAPRVYVRALSDADRATARLIYSLPAGRLRMGSGQGPAHE